MIHVRLIVIGIEPVWCVVGIGGVTGILLDKLLYSLMASVVLQISSPFSSVRHFSAT